MLRACLRTACSHRALGVCAGAGLGVFTSNFSQGSQLPSRRLRREFCRTKSLSPLSNQCPPGAAPVPGVQLRGGHSRQHRESPAPPRPRARGAPDAQCSNPTISSMRREGTLFSLPFKTPPGTHTSKPSYSKAIPISYHGCAAKASSRPAP